jgi:TonB-linked SusC/RagA family outer membrane protein
MYKIIIHICVFAFFSLTVHAQEKWTIEGKVVDKFDASPIVGASITIQNRSLGTLTDENGHFKISSRDNSTTLSVSYLGYINKQLDIKFPLDNSLTIALERNDQLLEEVLINTGYQSIPKERATGSFVQIDSAILNRRVSTDILARLEDVTPGLIFTRGIGTGNPPITIRGQSTIQANTAPLVVIDNFPYEGDFSSINPNDVESITVLKDAAAASIWGARSGNGVIVITTKKGRYNEKAKVTLNSNLTLGNKPDQFYQSRISTADFIDIEKMLFAQGYYKAAEKSTNKYPLTPVVEMLIQGGMENEIEALKNIDVRNDYDQYLNRKSLNQQYNLNITGGGENQLYYFSAGYDDNKDNLIGNGFNRLSLNAKNTFSFLNKRLEFSSDFYYSEYNRTMNGLSSINITTPYGSSMELYPYARLVDEEGAHLPITYQYRLSFLEKATQEGLLNWDYVPLDEFNIGDNRTKFTDYRINTSIRYKVLEGLNANVLYQYARAFVHRRNLQSVDSYYARNQINRLTIVNLDGSLERPIPLGGVVDYGNGTMNTHNLRGQLNFNKEWEGSHRIDAVGGAEIRDQLNHTRNHRLYGYDEEHALSGMVDYLATYKSYINPASTNNRILNQDSEKEQTDRFLSYYSNVAYSHLSRYTLSASGRLDQSNLFGVNTNHKGVPLFSVGASWNLSDEPFYRISALPFLKLRATYGYNGNIDKSTSAYVTASFSARDPNTGLRYATIRNPPNPELRWERVKVINLGMDFSFKRDVLSGSVEYYRKNGVDLIGVIPYYPSSGIEEFKGNYANTRGRGMDIVLNGRILNGRLKWTNSLFISSANEIVSNYKQMGTISSYRDDLQIAPMEGKPLYGIYNYAWAGLDPENGNPRGYLNGEISSEYSEILKETKPEDLVFIGSSRPTRFGAFRNTFSYHKFSLSFNVSYRLGYYFRKNAINFNALLRGEGSHGDYNLRWQKMGDEKNTQVPSIPLNQDLNRHNFYQYSEVHAEKGDHVRLQDISFSYDFKRNALQNLPFSNIQVYLYANNIGILWKAANTELDPDYARSFSPPIRTLSAGVKINF